MHCNMSYNIGKFSLVGEQGAEGIHTVFNNLKRRFSGMPDSVGEIAMHGERAPPPLFSTEHSCQVSSPQEAC